MQGLALWGFALILNLNFRCECKLHLSCDSCTVRSLYIKLHLYSKVPLQWHFSCLSFNPLWFWFGQTIIKKFQLREQVGAQHQTYALGIKEVWATFHHGDLLVDGWSGPSVPGVWPNEKFEWFSFALIFTSFATQSPSPSMHLKCTEHGTCCMQITNTRPNVSLI